MVFLNLFSVRATIDISFGEDRAMAKYKSYSYSQNVLIPVSLEEQLVPGTLEFAIHYYNETAVCPPPFPLSFSIEVVGGVT